MIIEKPEDYPMPFSKWFDELMFNIDSGALKRNRCNVCSKPNCEDCDESDYYDEDR